MNHLSTVVLFDGVCLFCEGWVNFVIDRNIDSHKIVFVPLQLVVLNSDVIDELNSIGSGDSIFCLTSDDMFYFKSDASLKSMRHLRGIYGWLARTLFLLPRSFRNIVYDFVGRNRYNIWGRKDLCILPSGERSVFFASRETDLPVEMRDIYLKYFSFRM